MTLKVLSWTCMLICFTSLTGMFVLIRNTSPSWALLLFYFIGVVGGGIFAIWSGDKKSPNRLIISALVGSFLTFLILGFGRIAPLQDRVGYLELALLTTGATFVLAYFGLEEHEKKG